MTQKVGRPSATEGYQQGTSRHVFVPWAIQQRVTQSIIVGGKRCWLYDLDGRAYLDFNSQHVVANLGHCHPKVVAAIQAQAQQLPYISPVFFANEARNRLADAIVEIAPPGAAQVLFTTGGSDANENAIKFARWYTGKFKLIARYRSYHGASHGSLALSGDFRRWPSEPAMPGVVRVLDPYQYRCRFCRNLSNCDLSCLNHVEDVIRAEGPQHIAAVFVEGVTGMAGLIVPPEGYMSGLRELCDKYNMLLVVDEVMSGFGRTGQWFSVDHWNVSPDIITFAKGATGGHVPLGGVIISERVAEFFATKEYWGGLTFSGHPLACAAALAAIRAYEEERLIENSRTLGEVLLDELRVLQQRHVSVGDVRGLGLFAALELVKDRDTREPLVDWQSGEHDPLGAEEIVRRIRGEAWNKGLFLYAKWNLIYITPPLCITREELKMGLETLDYVLGIADEAVGQGRRNL